MTSKKRPFLSYVTALPWAAYFGDVKQPPGTYDYHDWTFWGDYAEGRIYADKPLTLESGYS